MLVHPAFITASAFGDFRLNQTLVVQLHAEQDQSRDSDSALEYEQNPAHNVSGREVYGEREKNQ